MAESDNGHVYYTTRDSYMCVSAEMQGFLEKKGVLGNKSKFWCSIQQSTLYMQKSNGQKSQNKGDIVKTIDLKDCHQVRKVTAEITGTHFEICQKKKTHVFVCPTNENCTMWVKALQAAMALKDAGPLDSDPAADSKDSSHVYESISDVVRHSKRDAVSSCKIEYCEPSDSKKLSRAGNNNNNEYWEVGDAAGKFERPQSTSQTISDVNQQTYSDAQSEASEAGQCEYEQGIYSDGVSLASEDKKSVSVISQVKAAHSQRNSVVRRESASNLGVYSDACSATSVHQHPPVAVRIGLLKPADSDGLKDAEDEEEGPFEALLDSLTNRDSPIPDFDHPLTEDDMKPVRDLREFLDRNRELCHVDYIFLPIEDPVNSLKSYIETLSIAETGH